LAKVVLVVTLVAMTTKIGARLGPIVTSVLVHCLKFYLVKF